MPVEAKLDFAVTYESLFRNALSSDLKGALRSVGLELDKPLLPAYPAAMWPEVMRVVAATLYPGVPFLNATRTLGERFSDASFDQTMMGRALTMVMRAVGPMRTLERFQRMIRSTINDQQTRFEVLSRTSARLSIAHVSGVPGWFAGVIERTARKTGVDGTVEVETDDGVSATFLVAWK